MDGRNQQQIEQAQRLSAFIRQSGQLRAQEIKFGADQQYNIKKGEHLTKFINVINAEYEKKLKQADLAEQISRSQVGNESRLKVLEAQQVMLDRLFDRVREQLADAPNDSAKYEKTLVKLIVEGITTLNEPSVTVRVREADKSVAEKAIATAKKQVPNPNDTKLEVQLDATYLPTSSLGGVIVIGGRGKIEVDNTFETRLRLAQTESLPSIRKTLLGDNPNRRFND